MNGNGQPESNKNVILMVVGSLAINLTISVAALGYTLIGGVKADATLLTAFVGLTGTLAGYFGGMLSRTTPATSPQQMEVPTEKKA